MARHLQSTLLHQSDANSFWDRLFALQPSPQPSFPTLDAGQKKFNSRLVGPRWFTREPTVVFVIPKVGKELPKKEDHSRSR